MVHNFQDKIIAVIQMVNKHGPHTGAGFADFSFDDEDHVNDCCLKVKVGLELAVSLKSSGRANQAYDEQEAMGVLEVLENVAAEMSGEQHRDSAIITNAGNALMGEAVNRFAGDV